MALFSGTLRSAALAMDTDLTVILPWDRPAEHQSTPCPVLYLLHGLGDNHAAWTRYTGIERYAREKGLAVVMPEVQRSFYCDMAHGPDYFTFLTDELPALCTQLFHLQPGREHTYVAGLSMGGYGALKCALTHPERYRGAASFSGALDVVRIFSEHSNEKLSREYQAVLGTDLVVGEENDLLRLAEKVGALPKQQHPDIFITCGTEDFLHGFHPAFLEHLGRAAINHTYREWPGAHTWEFWDRSVQLALAHWFPPAERPAPEQNTEK